jgi:hypothetical protein
MATEKRDNLDRNRNTTGIFLGKVVNHLDTTYMGGIQVEILRKSATGSFQGETVACKYASPFYGQTPYSGLSENSDFASTQKSYGFWAVPPDIGTQVIVVMPEGDFSQAYWIGCVPDVGMNFMTPGYAGTTYNDQDTAAALPVGEYNKLVEGGDGKDVTQITKPADPNKLEQLEESGLKTDHIRGTTTSSARREVPSMVFGMSTPGPHDPDGPKHQYGPTIGSSIQAPFNRLGGSSFVMDDGDPSLFRKMPAKDDKMEYANLDAGDTSGDKKIPANELIRLKTRSGHQILLHNSEDLIYISHGSGKSWIEMTANGKIEIYSEDSVSINTDNDLNLNAGRDINMAAKEDINIIADKDIKMHSLEKTTHHAKNYKMHVENRSDIRIDNESYTRVGADQHLWVEGAKLTIIKNEMRTMVDNTVALEANRISHSAKDRHTMGSSNTFINSNLEVNGRLNCSLLNSGAINGTGAGSPWPDSGPGDDQKLNSYSFQYTGEQPELAEGGEEAKEFEDDEFAFYVKRIPKHEPWEEHENLDPQKFIPDETQSTEKERPEEEESEFEFPPIDDTFKKG